MDTVKKLHEDFETYQSYKSIFDYSPAGLLVLDKKGKIVVFNNMAQKLFASSGRELKDMQLSNFIRMEERKAFTDKKKAALKNNVSQILKTKITGTESQPKAVTLSLGQGVFCGKQCVIVSAVAVDGPEEGKGVSFENKIAATDTEALQLEIQNKMLWENMFEGMFFLNEGLIIQKVNSAFCTIIGKNKEELINKPIDTVFDKPIAENAREVYYESFSKFIGKTFENEITLWNGKKIWIGWSVCRFNAGNNKSVWSGKIRDISDRKKAEEMLLSSKWRLEAEVKKRVEELSKINRELNEQLMLHKKLEQSLQYSRSFLNKIINMVSSPIFVKDGSHAYIMANESLCHLLGKSKYEILGKNEFDLFETETAQMNYDVDEILLRREINSKQYQMETEINGQKKIIVMNKEFYEDENKEKFIVCSAMEITKIVQAEEEVLKALHKEKELNEMKSKFVSMVSHEYRTPLTSIMSSVELIDMFGEEMPLEEKKKHYNRIYTCIKNLTNMLTDILTLNKAEAGKTVFNPVNVEIVEFCKRLAEEEMINFKSRVKIQIVSSAEFATVVVDTKLLTLIFRNLLSNSIKYSPEGSTVFFSLEIKQENILFSVKDYGKGIPMEEQHRLFEVFFRAKNVMTIPGSGLGLSIVKRCVDLHGGEISFTSEENKGAEFRVLIPYSLKLL